MRYIWVLLLAALLSGCAGEETVETVADVWAEPVTVIQRSLHAELPEDAVCAVSDSGFYQCDGFDIAIQTLSAGDLNATLHSLTGYQRDALTVLETPGETRRYDFVWVSTGENGEMIHRGLIFDDGNFHYCLCAAGEAARQREFREIWQEIFAGASLA